MNNKQQLWKKTKRGFFEIIFSRTAITVILLVVQIVFLLVIYISFRRHIMLTMSGVTLVAVAAAIYLLNTEDNPTVKITWIVLTTLAPLFGLPLSIYIKSDLGFRTIHRRHKEISNKTKILMQNTGCGSEELEEKSKELCNIASYIAKSGTFPTYKNTSVKYFATGESKFEEMLKQLEQAKNFIFFEYFIVDEGYMWSKILDMLSRKSKIGVEVRVMYDGTCAFATLPYSYPNELEKLGIQCKMHAPIRPFISTHYNNRDHRKILVIDGCIAFTGGLNIADEYINLRVLFGDWKDAAIMITGEAVKSFTMMFLQMWNVNSWSDKEVYSKYLSSQTTSIKDSSGYVIPYGDSPFEKNKVGKMVYMDIINQAKDYVHIMAPYLIIDGEFETALCFVAQRGVDVKLILPHITDKKFTFNLAKSHYKVLIDAGVKIYEYTPGFVHAKVFISDDTKAIVGTINLDYRSLYHHFECAVYLYKVPAALEIEKDMKETLEKCQLITIDDVKNERFRTKLHGKLLKLLAPLM